MQFFTVERPLGPNATPKNLDRDSFNSLFDIENEIYKSLNREPIVLVGRRGAGKTAFLKSFSYVRKNVFTNELDAASAFAKVVKAINEIAQRDGLVFPEQISRLWIYIFTLSAMHSLCKSGADRSCWQIDTIWRYLENNDPKFIKKNVIDFSLGILRTAAREATGIDDILSNLVDEERGPVSLGVATTAINSYLEERDIQLYITIDSLEDFQLDEPLMAKSIKGLLRALREFSEDSDRMAVLLCLPAELFHEFFSLSTNPLKDFERLQLLQWSGRELLHLAANRYRYFLHVLGSDSDKRFVDGFDFSDRTASLRFWRSIFPEHIVNGSGLPEDPLAYLLRHTQLLPRQIIDVLNSVLSINIREYRSRIKVTNSSFVSGVRNIESRIVDEIFVGFKPVYPHAKTICELILPQCETFFFARKLQPLYNKLPKELKEDGFGGFLRMLSEIGAIGSVRRFTDRYVVGEFEYSMPSRNFVQESDQVCIHPLFLEKFQVKRSDKRTIYPLGIDVEAADYREWVESS
jgi:hypothetical protein